MDTKIYTADKRYKLEVYETSKAPAQGYFRWQVYENVAELGCWRMTKQSVRYDTYDDSLRQGTDRLLIEAFYSSDKLFATSQVEQEYCSRGFDAAKYGRKRDEYKRVKPEYVKVWQAGWDAYHAFKDGLIIREMGQGG